MKIYKPRKTYHLEAVIGVIFIVLSHANPPAYANRHSGHSHGRHQKQSQPPLCATQTEQKPPTAPNFDNIHPAAPLDSEMSTDKVAKPELSIFPGAPHGPNVIPSPISGPGIQIFPPGSQEPVAEVGPDQIPNNPKTCPDGSGIDKKTDICYKFANKNLASEEPSPCGPFMEFYQSNSNPTYGQCDCKDQHLGISRPIAYWEKSDQCFWLFDQGPCQSDEWLVLNDNDVSICSKRSCPENTLDDWDLAKGNKKYWFRHRGKCYKFGSKGFCDDPELNIYLVLRDQRYVTECKQFNIEVKTLLNGAKPLPCMPGQKESATGECRKSATFE